METKLLPCPFCGGEAKLSDYSIKPFAACKECGASMPDRHQAEAEAIEAWNRRYERKGENLRGDDNETLCSECGTLVVDMAYFDNLGGGMVMVRNYPDYCPKCGVRLE